jgi:RNA polymerase sigma factor (sigma-70 family)
METSIQLSMTDQKANSITGAIQQFGKNLFGFVRGKVRSTEDAEDIVQDVWYQMSKLNNIAELENVSAWLYEVARNKITDKSRKKTNQALEDFSFIDQDGEFNFKEILLLDDSNNPEIGFFKEMFWSEFEKAIDELPENQKEVFLLNEMEDMTLQQIADIKGENIKTIISRKGYAVKHLRSKLNYLYNELNS